MAPNPLFASLIDYAGVFPPAGHSLATATRRYEAAQSSADGWILGPMLIRASQLEHYAGKAEQLGLILDAPIPATTHHITQIETRTDASRVAGLISGLVGLAPVVYLESQDAADLTFLEAIRVARASGHDVRAKIRTGGASAAAFPSSMEVAEFIRLCRNATIPFKATAGLHYPIRHPSQVGGAVEHGFINLLAAVRCSLSEQPDATVECLEETDHAAFDLKTATWRDVGAAVPVGHVRSVFRSIGSCSFQEPAGYLRDLGVI